MASLVYRSSSKSRELRFFWPKNHKRVLMLGKCPLKAGRTMKVRIEELIYHKKTATTLNPELSGWVSGLDGEVREKLVEFGLLEPQGKVMEYTIPEWIDKFIKDRGGNKKEGTRENYRQTKRCLVEYFGETRTIGSITEYDAESFKTWLATSGGKARKAGTGRDKKRADAKNGAVSKEEPQRKGLADNTVRRRIGRSKQFFGAAVRAKLIPENPFEQLASTTYGSAESRQHFVSREDTEKCIEAAPGGDWQTIIALARYGGLRCPSDLIHLRWENVDLPAGRMTIHSPKTEHHRTGGVRQCPIFPELRPYLEAAWDALPEDGASEYVITNSRYRNKDANLGTTFAKIIKRAGLVPWPKLFQNLRASRETELLALYPIKDVVSWIGNSKAVAMKHYAMKMPDSFSRAIEQGANVPSWDRINTTSGQNQHQQATAGDPKEA